MGVAARKIAHQPVRTGPGLRLVGKPARKPRSRAAARASERFRLVVFCLLVLALAGVARVSLAARAAEATVDAWELRADVKAERLAGRTLEADRSALAAPSRIEAVAAETLNMTRPTQVSYMQLPTPSTPSEAQGAEGTERSPLLATLVDLAAGEAQVMLVGDVGLGSLQ